MYISAVIRKVKKLLLVISPLAFLAVKCERPETVGPEYAIAPDGFAVYNFSVGDPTVNFGTTPKDTFYASFSHNVSWFIDLKGLRSGATKRISGISQNIDGNNPLWLWDGSHEGLYFFMLNEPVEASISFLGTSLVYKDTLTIAGTKPFQNQGVLLSDFENGLPLNGQWPNWVAGPTGVYTDGDADAKGIYLDTTGGFKIVQGRRAYKISGTDGNNTYFVCGMRKGNINTSTFPSADSIYLNLYIYGKGDANSKLNFGAQEDDNNGTLGTHDPATDDEYQVQITLDHVGWKLFSYKYSDLAVSNSPSNGGSGNRIHEPKRITGITFSLISGPPKNYVEALIDYPIITFGGPFNPAK